MLESSAAKLSDMKKVAIKVEIKNLINIFKKWVFFANKNTIINFIFCQAFFILLFYHFAKKLLCVYENAKIPRDFKLIN